LSSSFIKANPYPGISTNTKAGITPYPSDDDNDGDVEIVEVGVEIVGFDVGIVVVVVVVDDDDDDDDDDDVILTLPTP
jgi:hypothetical protein